MTNSVPHVWAQPTSLLLFAWGFLVTSDSTIVLHLLLAMAAMVAPLGLHHGPYHSKNRISIPYCLVAVFFKPFLESWSATMLSMFRLTILGISWSPTEIATSAFLCWATTWDRQSQTWESLGLHGREELGSSPTEPDRVDRFLWCQQDMGIQLTRTDKTMDLVNKNWERTIMGSWLLLRL